MGRKIFGFQFLLLAISNVLFQGIECHVRGRIKSYGKEYTKSILDLSDLNQEKKFILQNCSSVLWSDENCISGPFSLLEKTIPVTLKQVCPQSSGKFYISCGYYAVCQNYTVTINKCPATSVILVCPKTSPSECKNISTGSSDVNFIKSLVANQGSSLTQPTSGDERVKKSSQIHPNYRTQSVEVKKENEKKSPDPEDKDETRSGRDPSTQLESDGTRTNASYSGRLVYNDTNDEDVTRESEQAESEKSKFLPRTSLCANFSNGIIRHPNSCEHFIQCVHGVEHVMSCGPGTVFNAAMSVCDWASNVLDCITTKSTGGDVHINLNDNRVRRSAMDHYNGISNTDSWMNEVLSKHGDSSSSRRVRRDAAVSGVSSPVLPVKKTGRKCSWSENYIQPHSDYCNKFEICSNGRIVEETCGPGSLFNPLSLVCDQPDNVDCLSRRVDYSTYGCQKTHSYRTSDFESCSKFVECDKGNLHIKTCPPGTLYDDENELCDFSHKVKCKKPISLEHDIDVNYLPPLPRSPRSYRNNLNLACDYNYIAPNPRFCDQFVECENRRLFFKSCGPGTVFNGEIGQCDWAYNTRRPDPLNCNQYLQCERSVFQVKRCRGNTVYDPAVKKCIFSPRFPNNCHSAVTTTTTTTARTYRPAPPPPEGASIDVDYRESFIPG